MRHIFKPVILLCITILVSCETNIENPDSNPINDSEHSNWIIPKGDVIYRGETNDFVPSLENPSFLLTSHADFMSDNDMIL